MITPTQTRSDPSLLIHQLKQKSNQCSISVGHEASLNGVAAPILSANDIPLIGSELQKALGFLNDLTNTNALDTKLQTIINNDFPSGQVDSGKVQTDVNNALGNVSAFNDAPATAFLVIRQPFDLIAIRCNEVVFLATTAILQWF